EYDLEEVEAPKGFAKISDIRFLVSANGKDSVMNIKYNTEDQAENAQQIVNKKVTIPQTGGIGTIIFTVAGLALMLGAAYAIKKNREEA
ncbi:LPXTG cell wall anchor domain-containing protein, partial [Peptostreptococcus porci]|uniref:LPXTG cell wall anchor domain-containing protein n=1 Tax=Peptostreptococcus porci TaxID=2652282 RepID=UPI002A90FD2E